MRHFSTLLAALLVAPLSWLLLAFGQDRSVRAFAGPLAAGDLLRQALCLAGAGLLLGLLATLRISPLGAVLTGAAYSASYLAVLVDPEAVLGASPRQLSLAGLSVDLIMPLRTGTALLLGALLLVGTFSVGRWRRRLPGPVPARPDFAEQAVAMGAVAMGAVAMGAVPIAEPAPTGDWPAPTGKVTVENLGSGNPPGQAGPTTLGAPAQDDRTGQHRAEIGQVVWRPDRPGPGRGNAGDRWVGNRQPGWPYPEPPRRRSRPIWE